MDTAKDAAGAGASPSGEDINIDIRSNNPDTVADNSMVPDESARAGLTKDELMKYANMPFWVRLRNTLFAAFWIVWVSILIAAIGYVVHSPGCKLASASAVSNSTGPSPPPAP